MIEIDKTEKPYSKSNLSKIEYGLMKYAHLKAEATAKFDETVEETRARANKIWKEEIQWHREQSQMFIHAVMSLPEEHRRELLDQMRKIEFGT